MIVGGVDEAGRGCIIGALVVAGVSARQGDLKHLAKLGVKDSKLLTPQKRSILYGEIRNVCRVFTEHIEPPEIDEYVKYGKKYRKLNYLEAKYMAKLIDRLRAPKVYVDAPDTNPSRFALDISRMVKPKSRIIAEHHADRNYTIVAAASIVAKVERDVAIERLRSSYGEFGSGYPSDDRTIAFLVEWVKKNDSLPSFSRKSWKSWERILTQTLD